MSYQRIFLLANPGPIWSCYFCGEEVTERGRQSLSLVVHHVDEDPTNNNLANLTSAHLRCHAQHHMSNRQLTESTREKLRKPKSPATRARMSAAQRHRPYRPVSDETKAKLSKIVTGRRYPDDVRAKMREARRIAAEKRRTL